MTISELKPYGLEEMRDEEIANFLDSQSVGVLGLPGEQAPYLLPLSYAFDGESTLYFTYVLGEDSQKGTLTAQTERARFLVYSADTMFNWESVLLEGTFEELRPSQWGDISDLLEDVWRPEVFETSKTARNVKIYGFEVDEQSGIKHTGLSPEMQ
jgi:nitroimidazol reductase NimA-like FMN-containing flavoprotein (pyridoxamine 5'-phosphate oxidase superfamily)